MEETESRFRDWESKQGLTGSQEVELGGASLGTVEGFKRALDSEGRGCWAPDGESR